MSFGTRMSSASHAYIIVEIVLAMGVADKCCKY
jgi:hypothetical protein